MQAQTTSTATLHTHTLTKAVSNTLTFAYRALLKLIKSPESWMDITIMPIMFTLLFSYLFGGAIAGGVKAYLPTIIPGILIQTLVTSCGVSGTNLREDTDKSIANRFKSMPISRLAPLTGTLLTDLLRYLVAALITIGMGLLMGYRPAAGFSGIVLATAFIILFAWCLSWLFVFIAMSVKNVATASTTATLIMFPLCFLSSGLVPTATLPSGLRFFANHINPVTPAIDTVRHFLAGTSLGNSFWMASAMAVGILVIFVPLTLAVYKKKG